MTNIRLLTSFSTINIPAQVTIALDEDAVSGSLLQIKDIKGIADGGANSIRGLL